MKMDPISTERLIIREFELSDVPAVHEYGSDPEVVAFMEWGPNELEDTEKFIKDQIARQEEVGRKIFEPAITLKDSGVLIGGVGVTLENGVGIVGNCLNKKYWGQGYATEATKAIMEWGRVQFGLTHFRATCDVKNEASKRVLEKCGLKVVRKEERQVEVRGKWRDTYFLEN